MKEKYILSDKTNERVISRHRTIRAAVKAQHAHDRRLKLANGYTAYVHYKITHRAGLDISDEVATAFVSMLF